MQARRDGIDATEQGDGFSCVYALMAFRDGKRRDT